jgi:hypothetical protein
MAKLTVEFSPGMDQIISDLSSEKGLSKVEVIRRAVALYKYLDKELADGSKQVAITKDEKVIKELVLP